MSSLPPSIDIPVEESNTLELWKNIDAFQTSIKQSLGKPRYSFYDGPPFATGLPHYGHLLAGTIKDIITRYAHQSGFHVDRRFGWDCHGLPVEFEVDKELGITGPHDVEKMGVGVYNNKCRDIVMRYSNQWEIVTGRLGRWIDFKNDYRTMYPWFMESVWWVFKQLFEKGLVYRGVKVMPFSTACSTPLSNFEAGQNYRDVQDPANSDEKTELIAWTTTPWTLVSNLALCVHPEKEYVKILDISKNRTFIMMKARLPSLYKREDEYKIMETFKGEHLKGLSYRPIFDYFAHMKQTGAFKVLCDTYVTEDTGTGVVHQAPYFGEDDFRVCLANGVISKDSPMVCPLDLSGRFTEEVKDFVGTYVKEADKQICQNLKQRGRLVHQSTITHSYPFCWRSDTPLIYRAIPTWFIRVEQLVDRLLENNSKTYWVPDFVREGRFANWLRDARDWAVSRNRFWGTPIPLWVSDDFQEVICIGSMEELRQKSGVSVKDLHKEFVDSITIPSRTGRGVLRRIPEVFDCWFESGSMPYAQLHYPFENTKAFEEGFPADFIAEGIDQTRGWFYTLLVISTALFDKPPFKNLIVNGIVLAADGQKMSKRAKNYPDPVDVINKHGADALRLYLINSPVVRAQNLRFMESGVQDVIKDVFLPWYNALRFLIESSVIPFERATRQKFMIKPNSIPKTTNFMDKWILSFMQSLIKFVHQELREYRLYTVVPRLVKFIDHLVNWYVRMNRKRLKGDAVEDENDWRAALHTLTKVIYQMTLVMSPFTPFMTEFIYQHLRSRLDFTDNITDPAGLPVGFCRLTGAPDSVHYLPICQPDELLIVPEIENTVSWMQTAVELGRIIRTRCNLPLKAPLREAIVIHPDLAVLQVIKNAEQYIVEELNVRTLTATDDKHRYGVQLRGVLNHRTLGVRLRQAYKSVVNAINQISTQELEQYVATGRITVCGQELSGDDLTVVYTTGSNSSSAGASSGNSQTTTESTSEPNTKKNNKKKNITDKNSAPEQPTAQPTESKPLEQYETASDSRGLLVLLDTTPDAELEDERLARELMNRIQRTRKKANLVPDDPIVVAVITKSEDLHRVATSSPNLIALIQSTVKQPMAVIKTDTIQVQGDAHLVTVAKANLPQGWTLGSEIIREVVSIPPDDSELVLFARHQTSKHPNPSSVVPGQPVSIVVVHHSSNKQCQVKISDGQSNVFVHDSDDLLRKVRCAFGWTECFNLFLHHPASNLQRLDHLPYEKLVSLSGKTLILSP